MQRRTALVLRGPLGVGKSTVADELCGRLQAGSKIVFDDGWLIGGDRYSGCAGRYDDLRNRGSQSIVVELGCGEPVDLSFPGATRGAHEWLDVLSQEGREPLLFRLMADWSKISRQMQGHRAHEVLSARLWFNAYLHKDDIVSLPADVIGRERIIDVTSKSPQVVASEILHVAGIV